MDSLIDSQSAGLFKSRSENKTFGKNDSIPVAVLEANVSINQSAKNIVDILWTEFP